MFRNWCAYFLLFCCGTGSLLVAGGVQGSGTGSNINALRPVGPTSPPLPPLPPLMPTPPPHQAAVGEAQPQLEPQFDESIPTNVTALVGKSAYLSCRVRNLGNKSVSWVRHRDIHILTVGMYTYTSDQRFQSNYHPQTDEWILQIKWAQTRDAGIYECQISTQPVKSHFVNLNIVVPKAEILGGPDLHVDMGSTINLTCTIRLSPEPPTFIFWYHFDEVISYNSKRGGISVITEKGDVTTSFLLIQRAVDTDSGRYSCSPSNAERATVHVHVLNGERPAAMQTGSAGLSNSCICMITLLIVTSVYQRCFVALHLAEMARVR